MSSHNKEKAEALIFSCSSNETFTFYKVGLSQCLPFILWWTNVIPDNETKFLSVISKEIIMHFVPLNVSSSISALVLKCWVLILLSFISNRPLLLSLAKSVTAHLPPGEIRKKFNQICPESSHWVSLLVTFIQTNTSLFNTVSCHFPALYSPPVLALTLHQSTLSNALWKKQSQWQLLHFFLFRKIWIQGC